MSNPSNKIAIQVPLHYQEYAPNFLVFMERYYDWLHRTSGLSKEEIQSLSEIVGIENAVKQNAVLNPGAASDLLADLILMEEIHQDFVTADDEYFVDNNQTRVQIHIKSQESIDGWMSSFGLRQYGKKTDPVLMISLMKHVNAIKGTQKSIELFFNIFFNEEIEVYYPKFDIAIIEDNMIPDVSGVIRDDFYYNEFSYVIRVSGEVNNYTDLFQEVYMKNVHPAGFKVFLERK